MAKIKNILLIDDEPFVIIPVLQYLADRGYSVVATNSPEAATSLIAADRFDVIITDLKMRSVSGIDIIRQLRVAGFAGKIILISAFFKESKEEMDALKIDAFTA